MKPSHRKDVIIARVIFGIICIAIIAIISAIVVVVASHKKPVEEANTETQTESDVEPETEQTPVYIPNDTEVIEAEIFYKTTAGVNMRQEPSTDAAVVTVLPEGFEVKYISEDNGWTQVEYEGQVGYVSSEFLVPVEAQGEDLNTDEMGTPESEESSVESEQN